MCLYDIIDTHEDMFILSFETQGTVSSIDKHSLGVMQLIKKSLIINRLEYRIIDKQLIY